MTARLQKAQKAQGKIQPEDGREYQLVVKTRLPDIPVCPNHVYIVPIKEGFPATLKLVHGDSKSCSSLSWRYGKYAGGGESWYQ